jgi:hypothetical protein
LERHAPRGELSKIASPASAQRTEENTALLCLER